MQNKCRAAGKAVAGTFPGSTAVRASLLLVAGLWAPALLSQVLPDDLQYLMFDAVPLDAVAAVSAAPAALTPESTAIGSAGSAPADDADAVSDLRAWLGLRQLSLVHQDPASLAPDISRYQRTLAEIELSDGPYAPRLDQELLALGNLYQQSGDFSQALEVLERAIHINRVNNGLFNLGQMPIIEKAIENHLARGDLVAADTQQEYMFYLQRKALGDTSVELLPALTRYAEWNVFAYNARPQLLAVPSPQSDPDTDAEAPPVVAAASIENLEAFRYRRLMTAQSLYQAVIQILVNNYGERDPRLPEFERRLAITNYFFATTFDPSADYGPGGGMAYASLIPYETPQAAGNSLGYRQGKDALERRVRYLRSAEVQDPVARARALVDLGDWYLSFRKRTGALEAYQDAFQVLQAANVPQAEIDKLLLPSVPIQVPGFLIHPYSRPALDIPDNVALTYKGYVDVEFVVSRFGAPASIKVLDKSADTPDAVESRLVRNIRRNIYRPRHDNGVVRESDPLRMRYYYTY